MSETCFYLVFWRMFLIQGRYFVTRTYTPGRSKKEFNWDQTNTNTNMNTNTNTKTNTIMLADLKLHTLLPRRRCRTAPMLWSDGWNNWEDLFKKYLIKLRQSRLVEWIKISYPPNLLDTRLYFAQDIQLLHLEVDNLSLCQLSRSLKRKALSSGFHLRVPGHRGI